jgi:hypothetical protein
MMSKKFNRRSVLRGAFMGGVATVGIPVLDCFLNDSGKAYADGAPIATRFGTYFWGLGLTPGRWVPKTLGENYETMPELVSLEALKKKISIFSGFRVLLDGRPNFQHWTGQGAVMSGIAPSAGRKFDRLTFDTVVADNIGVGVRFKSIEFSPFGQSKLSYSTRGDSNFNPAEPTPLDLYQRLFGEGFQDPNDPNWAPDPGIILRKSAMSAVAEQRQALMKEVGAADRLRLDQYFTAVRETEQQLGVLLEKPAPAEACLRPEGLPESKISKMSTTVLENNRLMSKLIAMALACNQTRVVNGVFTGATSEMYLPGDSKIYHLHTHDEAVNQELGYQPVSAKLAEVSIQGFADFLSALDSIPEGDGTLLDNMIVLGYSDTGYAKIHSTDNIPLFLAGGAGGAHKGGIHVASDGDPVTRISLTAAKLAGASIGSWGKGSMETDKAVTEVMA